MSQSCYNSDTPNGCNCRNDHDCNSGCCSASNGLCIDHDFIACKDERRTFFEIMTAAIILIVIIVIWCSWLQRKRIQEQRRQRNNFLYSNENQVRETTVVQGQLAFDRSYSSDLGNTSLVRGTGVRQSENDTGVRKSENN